MRILACADIHGHRERMERVRALVEEHRPDVVVLPGDLTHAGRGEDVLQLLDLATPVLAVPGNMDGPTAASRIRQRGRLDGPDPVTIGGVTFGGPRCASPCDVLVTHEPPWGVQDALPSGRHIGSRSVREQMQRLRPRLLLCGHVHEAAGITRVEGTVVVNCTMGDGVTAGALVEISGDDVRAHLL
jgi:Icc-related predicted phosphoesterase